MFTDGSLSGVGFHLPASQRQMKNKNSLCALCELCGEKIAKLTMITIKDLIGK